MLRNYDSGENDSVVFFTGTEVEHTPAFGKKTLFIVGVPAIPEIESYLSKVSIRDVEHLYFGANMSFPNPEINNAEIWGQWESMISHFLDKGYLCTLDIDSKAVEGLAEGCLCEYDNFIPMISVKLPYTKLLGYNATIKIDDKDFNATNPGVWCHSLHTLMDRSKFTDWSKYTNDKVIK